MSEPNVRIKISGGGKCLAEHLDSGTTMTTSSAPEFGGEGGAFSSTDLLITAIGTCIGSSLEKVLERQGIALEDVTIDVSKELAYGPKRIANIDINIGIPEVDSGTEKRIINTANTCVVKKALGDSVAVNTKLVIR